ncbi:hypothetical protein [Aliihoeflea sp. 40Bstr573]|uniref:hypothetical protein n=1 Tax=Aliihoeflea sp. 40Bstr573 TaxID=2696467 RepID=UPI0020943A4D|nr:hypothetical protein [Aliihoeflea sp. 40Bstr573]MCO6389299.1 hypothetical protein [Aliihoeflea sp. 40Bstr573]
MLKFLERVGLRRPRIPPLSPEMETVHRETISWCRTQLSAFYGQSISQVPGELDELHKQRIAAYAVGFLTGYVQVTGADVKWSGGRVEGLEMIGHMLVTSVVLAALFGAENAADRLEHLPSMGNTLDDLVLLDRAGGADGIAHAEGRSKQYGGALLHYLRENMA